MSHRLVPGSAWGLSIESADDWRDLAACRGEDPELFFPIGTSGPALLQVEQAKAVCQRCLVTEQCLAEALRRQEYGIWGGTTEAERAELIRRRRTKNEYFDMLRERYGDLADIERERILPARPPEIDELFRRALIKAMEAVQ